MLSCRHYTYYICKRSLLPDRLNGERLGRNLGGEISFPNGEGVVKSNVRVRGEASLRFCGGGTRVSAMTRRLPFPVMGQSDLGVSPTSLCRAHVCPCSDFPSSCALSVCARSFRFPSWILAIVRLLLTPPPFCPLFSNSCALIIFFIWVSAFPFHRPNLKSVIASIIIGHLLRLNSLSLFVSLTRPLFRYSLAPRWSAALTTINPNPLLAALLIIQLPPSLSTSPHLSSFSSFVRSSCTRLLLLC